MVLVFALPRLTPENENHASAWDTDDVQPYWGMLRSRHCLETFFWNLSLACWLTLASLMRRAGSLPSKYHLHSLDVCTQPKTKAERHIFAFYMIYNPELKAFGKGSLLALPRITRSTCKVSLIILHCWTQHLTRLSASPASTPQRATSKPPSWWLQNPSNRRQDYDALPPSTY